MNSDRLVASAGVMFGLSALLVWHGFYVAVLGMAGAILVLLNIPPDDEGDE